MVHLIICKGFVNDFFTVPESGIEDFRSFVQIPHTHFSENFISELSRAWSFTACEIFKLPGYTARISAVIA
jgi:hypothetical protein